MWRPLRPPSTIPLKWSRASPTSSSGGEGLFLTTLTGPGKVWLQTMSTAELAARIIPFLPKSN